MFYKFKNFDYLTFKVSPSYLKLRMIAQGNNSLWKRLLSYSYHFFKALNKIRVEFRQSDVIFIWSTENQKKSLLPIQSEYKFRHGNEQGLSYSIKNRVSADVLVPEFYSYFISLFSLPFCLLYALYSICVNREYKQFSHGLDRFLLSIGQYYVYYMYLSILAPKVIILSNDHNSEIRALLEVSRKKNIKTVFVQHATPNINLPPLEQFKYAFLDGECSLDIYSSIGLLPKEIKLIGIAKLDKVKRSLGCCNETYISVALNAIFDMKLLRELILWINYSGFTVQIRWHPGQVNKISNLSKQLNDLDVIFNDPRDCDLFSFILSSRILFSGNSNILLEAAILGIPTRYVQIDNIDFDYYHFVKNRITKEIFVGEHPFSMIFEKDSYLDFQPNESALKYYDDSIGEVYYGFSGVKACDYIEVITV
ncbi:hypothetical protein GL177_18770 [Vibrio toranzoniae]|uniref:hypothetical protein n=1 Tax=Vibrio toranzoniae TaxID=1194427 RepID=UPI00137659E6|nr:hypothetical protein [Vibrio toranzoniae]NAZ55357.1 hypothetical protein [Vibrio toranzoniae]